jgi:hypothetical protein
VPATFLLAAARQVVPAPEVFAWTWPVFGLAEAASTQRRALSKEEIEHDRVERRLPIALRVRQHRQRRAGLHLDRLQRGHPVHVLN